MMNENENYEFDDKTVVKGLNFLGTNGCTHLPGEVLRHFEIEYDDEDVLLSKKNVKVNISTESMSKDAEVKTAFETVIAGLKHLEIEMLNGIAIRLEIPDNSNVRFNTKEKEDEMRFVFSVRHEPDFDEEDEEASYEEDGFDEDDFDDSENDDY